MLSFTLLLLTIQGSVANSSQQETQDPMAMDYVVGKVVSKLVDRGLKESSLNGQTSKKSRARYREG